MSITLSDWCFSSFCRTSGALGGLGFPPGWTICTISALSSPPPSSHGWKEPPDLKALLSGLLAAGEPLRVKAGATLWDLVQETGPEPPGGPAPVGCEPVTLAWKQVFSIFDTNWYCQRPQMLVQLGSAVAAL